MSLSLVSVLFYKPLCMLGSLIALVIVAARCYDDTVLTSVVLQQKKKGLKNDTDERDLDNLLFI